jgi:hypothetical protein
MENSHFSRKRTREKWGTRQLRHKKAAVEAGYGFGVSKLHRVALLGKSFSVQASTTRGRTQ